MLRPRPSADLAVACPSRCGPVPSEVGAETQCVHPSRGLLSDAPGPSSPAGGLGEADPQSLIQMQNPEGSDHQMFLGNSFVRLGLTGSIRWWWWRGGLTGIETCGF